MSQAAGFFSTGLMQSDPELGRHMRSEAKRQREKIELIASENIVSEAVRQAQGSVFTNKYAEGYPGRRYYGGCEFADEVESLAIERVKQLYNCQFANVQPHSGSQANQAAFMSMMKPGDVFLGMSLAEGGHLTHGATVNQSGKWFQPVHYGVDPETHLIDFDQVRDQAKAHQPKVIIAGGSAYSRIIDFKTFREIADEVGAYLMVDMAHFSGLVAGGVYPNPIEHAHIVTTTTHKTLRGPRGGLVLTNDEKLAKKVNSAVFPGLQGGPLMHVIAAKAVAFGEALRPEYKQYAQRVVANAKALSDAVQKGGLQVVSGGTDSHVMLIDLRPKGVKGNATENALGRAFITCNKNGVPNDPEKPAITSGIRVGSPAGTTRGFGEAEFTKIGGWICEIVDALASGEDTEAAETKVREEVLALTSEFPIYPGDEVF
ncbi:serine hydroxymethyltransferase [Ponticaulis sp.]|uniref:serine hydroxymethyltransferase n=1 Tax=Ponticaulis sp. TaxID=2020902 RepID=UPI000B677033|nr:serine hydroxymethyltransferase [Ponticaulis sp.]OUX96310.1 MAG: serine hydroxymethyltransferase [Hyphomonadaceae bacterium TMED5]